MASTLNYKGVQALLSSLVSANGLNPGQAPHGVFWNSLSYSDFTTGNVPTHSPAIPPGTKILVVGDAANSNLIQVLSGTSNEFDQMPQPNPPYNSNTPTQTSVIQQLTDWINAGCPNNDDLTLVEGIGPAIHATLNDNGIHSFEDLAYTSVPKLRRILQSAGHGGHNPGTWPAQANLAHHDELDALKAFHSVLKGGKTS